jgi:phosphoserine phosphatase
LAELEQRYRAAEISNVEVAQRQAAHFIGRRVDELTEALASIPRIDGIDETLEWLRARNVEPILCTVTWRFAADCFRRWYGFTAVSGTEVEVDNANRLTGRLTRHFDKHDKPGFVTAYCAERAIPLSRCFAVGDSHGDVPLFNAVGFSIALNASPEARAVASVAIDSNTLTVVPPLLPALNRGGDE